MSSVKPKIKLCPQTGISLPECGCRRCCADLLRRYAPELASRLARKGGSR